MSGPSTEDPFVDFQKLFENTTDRPCVPSPGAYHFPETEKDSYPFVPDLITKVDSTLTVEELKDDTHGGPLRHALELHGKQFLSDPGSPFVVLAKTLQRWYLKRTKEIDGDDTRKVPTEFIEGWFEQMQRLETEIDALLWSKYREGGGLFGSPSFLDMRNRVVEGALDQAYDELTTLYPLAEGPSDGPAREYVWDEEMQGWTVGPLELALDQTDDIETLFQDEREG
ncbi:hypothetical protein BKA70DRAFT_680185 [Coprinopsis sp. MPI-PUGE-AT-0042]|nr:hypothetical protein BKA70DRAFT_680185 [Coprinopsis sp. MPI-PUGE-AT-0042]